MTAIQTRGSTMSKSQMHGSLGAGAGLLAKVERENDELRGSVEHWMQKATEARAVLEEARTLLRAANKELARHVFNGDSPACVLCKGESGFDVGRRCPEAYDYELAKRIDAALEGT